MAGSTPTPPPGGFQQGGWYNGQQYWNGSFSAPGVINSQSNQQGAGQAVSSQVVAQTNPNNNAYIASQQANPVNPVTAPSGGGGGAGGASGGGGTTGAGGVGMTGAPTFDLVAATNAAYNTPEIQAAQKAITDRQTALATASAGINDNPFYSEATRVGKQAKLTDQANNDIKVQQDQLASLKADAAIKVNAASGQYDINNNVYKENLSQFNNLLSAGALDNASGTDIANLAVQTGIPVSMIQSMVSTSQKKNNPVSLVQSTDNAGNLTLLGVDSNGKVVSTTTIPGAGKADKNTSGSNAKLGSSEYTSSAISSMTSQITTKLNSYNNIGPADWNTALNAWLAAGLTKKDFIDNFGQYADTNRGDFYTAYGFNNPKK